MSLRALPQAGIGAVVTAVHVGLVWVVGHHWSTEPVTPPHIQWIEAVPVASSLPVRSTSAASALPSAPARPAPVRSTAKPTVTPKPAPTAEPALSPTLPPLTLPAPEPASTPETRALAPAKEGGSTPNPIAANAAPDSAPGASGLATASGPGPGRTTGAITPPNQLAAYLNNPPPAYPLISKRLGEQGRVVVRVYIDERGVPKEAHIESRSGYSRLDNAAMDAVMSWRYVPAQRGGMPLAMWFNVPVTFDLKSNKD